MWTKLSIYSCNTTFGNIHIPYSILCCLLFFLVSWKVIHIAVQWKWNELPPIEKQEKNTEQQFNLMVKSWMEMIVSFLLSCSKDLDDASAILPFWYTYSINSPRHLSLPSACLTMLALIDIDETYVIFSFR